MKRIFYSEDVREAAKYIAAHPGALWARNKEECLSALEKEWDIVALAGDNTLEVADAIVEDNFPHLHATPIKVYSPSSILENTAVMRLSGAGYEAKRYNRPQ